MITEAEIKSFLSDLPLDLRVEVLLTDLSKKGYNINDLLIQPVGIFKRKFSRDIAHVETMEMSNYNETVVLKVNREGLYDVLPQSVFHYPAQKPKPFKTISEMVEETKQRILEEANARKYFFAYESEFFKHRIATEIQERKLLETITYTMDDEKILSYWDLPDFLDARQKGILFYLFPIIFRIRGSLDLMRETYSIMLRQKVVFQKTEPKLISKPAGLGLNRLGEMILSVDSIVGDNDYSIFEAIKISIGPVQKENLINFLPGGNGKRILDHLNSMFMPFNVEPEIEILTVKNTWTLDSKDKKASRLGYTAFLTA
ncbi:MAG: type VI secretion system baseplate subunit TssG [Bacteroidetes bacterium]|nr:type VI secretion system baseplate subunit TssG [Bacteroidota bacterium]MBL0066440.1 type VI secretion system baseplate subunit TssG [Bacteroidota bacterium]MBL0138908.1 type VI secretion system baseplate subunit TssG [Bacteroidota bacterium]